MAAQFQKADPIAVPSLIPPYLTLRTSLSSWVDIDRPRRCTLHSVRHSGKTKIRRMCSIGGICSIVDALWRLLLCFLLCVMRDSVGPCWHSTDQYISFNTSIRHVWPAMKNTTSAMSYPCKIPLYDARIIIARLSCLICRVECCVDVCPFAKQSVQSGVNGTVVSRLLNLLADAQSSRRCVPSPGRHQVQCP